MTRVADGAAPAHGPGPALPTLTREELIALADVALLGHSGDAEWWATLTSGEQAAVARTAQRSLVARGLLVPTGDGRSLEPVEQVRTVLRSRSAPDWLVVARDVEPDTGGRFVASGLPEAAVLSGRVDGLYLHEQRDPAAARRRVAEWVLRTEDAPAVRSVEIFGAGLVHALNGGPAGPAEPASTWASVAVASDGAQLAERTPDGLSTARPVDLDGLSDFIAGALSLIPTSRR